MVNMLSLPNLSLKGFPLNYTWLINMQTGVPFQKKKDDQLAEI